MPFFRVRIDKWFRLACSFSLALSLVSQPGQADDKPTGAPLVLSGTETEQEVPLAILLPDGRTAKCVNIRLHWNPKADPGPNDDATSFDLDLPADNPAAPIFTAQLWSASLASAMAWQQPWQGARWKVLQTPVTNGTGLDAALAVGMIATSARRPYPPKTVVIGSLNPDGSLGPVSHLVERMDAAAKAGMTRVIIPSLQRFDTDASGQVLNMVRHANDLHLECIPVDDLVSATQKTMNDPLPDSALDSSVPKYSNEIATYIDDFAHREQTEATSGLSFAPKEADLSTYPPRLAATWKSIYADYNAAQEAYRAGQVYVAYQLFVRANGRMNGANALAGQTRESFDVKSALAQSDELHDHLQSLMNPPSIDQGGLESPVLVAEMADWAFSINASLEGAQLVTKQAFSQRSDATEGERDRAREAILFANGQCKYLLTQLEFYTGLLTHLSKNNPGAVDANAAHLLPQLIPAQLATARNFIEGIRASELRDGLLFDPRLVAYVNVLRQAKTDWDARLRKKDAETQTDATATAATPSSSNSGTNSVITPVKPNSNSSTTSVGFDPGTTYAPPHTVLTPTADAKKMSDAALCLIWVNHDCEIATLDEKYLRLSGTMDPSTHEWRVKDRAKLDALLQAAEIGARHGIAFAEKAEIDPSVLAMIYERAAHERIQNDDNSALDALRNYWRCALLGNVCWQLAHIPKARAVDLSTLAPASMDKPGDKSGDKSTDKDKDGKKADTASTTKAGDKANKDDTAHASSATTNATIVVNPPAAPAITNQVVTPIGPVSTTNTVVVVNPPPAPATGPVVLPAAPNAAAVTPATAVTPTVAPPPVAPGGNPVVIPVAPAVPVAPVVVDPPVAPLATNEMVKPAPVAARVTDNSPVPAPPQPTPPAPIPAPSVTDATNEMNIPTAPLAKAGDYPSTEVPPTTNASPIAPVMNPAPPASKGDNADAHSF